MAASVGTLSPPIAAFAYTKRATSRFVTQKQLFQEMIMVYYPPAMKLPILRTYCVSDTTAFTGMRVPCSTQNRYAFAYIRQGTENLHSHMRRVHRARMRVHVFTTAPSLNQLESCMVYKVADVQRG